MPKVRKTVRVGAFVCKCKCCKLSAVFRKRGGGKHVGTTAWEPEAVAVSSPCPTPVPQSVSTGFFLQDNEEIRSKTTFGGSFFQDPKFVSQSLKARAKSRVRICA